MAGPTAPPAPGGEAMPRPGGPPGRPSVLGQQLQLLGPVVQRLLELADQALEDPLVRLVPEANVAQVPEHLAHRVDAAGLLDLEPFAGDAQRGCVPLQPVL